MHILVDCYICDQPITLDFPLYVWGNTHIRKPCLTRGEARIPWIQHLALTIKYFWRRPQFEEIEGVNFTQDQLLEESGERELSEVAVA